MFFSFFLFLLVTAAAGETRRSHGVHTARNCHSVSNVDDMISRVFYLVSLGTGTVLLPNSPPGPNNKNITKAEQVLRQTYAANVYWSSQLLELTPSVVQGVDALVQFHKQNLWPANYRQYLWSILNVDVLGDGHANVSFTYTAFVRLTPSGPMEQSLGHGFVTIANGFVESAWFYRQLSA